MLNGYLRQALEQEEVDAERVNALLEAAKLEGVPLDTATLEFAYRHKPRAADGTADRQPHS